jgi:hypothetical protein
VVLDVSRSVVVVDLVSVRVVGTAYGTDVTIVLTEVVRTVLYRVVLVVWSLITVVG